MARPCCFLFSEEYESRFDADRPCDDERLGVMRVAQVAEAIGDDAEPFGSANAMLDGNAEAAPPAVVILLLRVQLAAPAPFVGNFHGRVLPLLALVGTVGIEARRARQLHPFAADGAVVAAGLMRVRNAGDAPLGGDDRGDSGNTDRSISGFPA